MHWNDDGYDDYEKWLNLHKCENFLRIIFILFFLFFAFSTYFSPFLCILIIRVVNERLPNIIYSVISIRKAPFVLLIAEMTLNRWKMKQNRKRQQQPKKIYNIKIKFFISYFDNRIAEELKDTFKIYLRFFPFLIRFEWIAWVVERILCWVIKMKHAVSK